MEFFVSFLEWIYRVGVWILYGHNTNSMTIRTIIIGLTIGMIGYLPLPIAALALPASVAVLALAVYVWIFSLWHPSLREISGMYFGMTIIFGGIFSVTLLTR